MNRSRLAGVLSLSAVVALALPACGSSSKSSSRAVSGSFAAGAGTSASGALQAADGPITGAATATTAAAAGTAPAGAATTAAPAGGSVPGVGGATPVPAPPADRRVIVAVTLDLLVDDVATAGAKVGTMAETVGGYVASQQAALGGDHPSSTFVLKVPPDKVTALLTQVGLLGRVTNQTQQAEDVTAQFVDLDSRISSARASVERVRGFLARTANVTELAGLEAELTRRETELEQLVAAQQGLAARSAMATVTISLLRAPPVPVPTTTTVAPTTTTQPPLNARRALRGGTDVLKAIGEGLAITLAFLLPFVPVLAAVALVVWLVRRRSGRGRGPGSGSGSGPAPGGRADPPTPTPTPPLAAPAPEHAGV